MAEKILHELRVIETDDGFRIEVKGDKERLKKMGLGPGMMGFGPGMMGFGPQMFFARRFRGRHGHRPKHRFGRGHGPWGWWDQWGDEPMEEDSHEKAPKA